MGFNAIGVDDVGVDVGEWCVVVVVFMGYGVQC
jgi:hypothetical protein